MTSTFGVLALEFDAPANGAQPLTLPTEAVVALADAIARDLARFGADRPGLGLVVAGALFDASELLRPGFPIDAALTRARRRLGARAHGAVSALGAAGGAMEFAELEPDAAIGGGAMRYLPWQVHGDDGDVAAAGAAFEAGFDDEGLASAAVNLHLRDALSASIVHARYLTRNDLLALTALQLDNAGLGAAWTVIELALLAPEERERIAFDEGGALHFERGVAGIVIPGFDAFREANSDIGRASDAFAAALWRARASAALLDAHRVPLDAITIVGSDRETTGLGVAPGSAGGDVVALSHAAFGLIGFEVTDALGRTRRVWPIRRAELEAAGRLLRSRFTQTKTLAEWASVA